MSSQHSELDGPSLGLLLPPGCTVNNSTNAHKYKYTLVVLFLHPSKGM